MIRSKKTYVLAPLVLVICVVFALPGGLRAQKPEITADAAALMVESTGQLLFAKNAHERRPTASTTKILTALLAIEQGNPQDEVVVSSRAAQTGGSTMWLREEERMTLEELLYGLMLPSGNDAAVAIAEHLAGSVEEFMDQANLLAASLGARDTHFKNPHGLPADTHFSTVYDLSLISRFGFRYPLFEEIVGTSVKRVTGFDGNGHRVLYNTNILLDEYPGADGVKTGYTDAAGQCVVISATRDGMRLIASVLHSDTLWEDARRVLDYGFDEHTTLKFFSAEDAVRRIEVGPSLEGELVIAAADKMEAVIPRGAEDEIEGHVVIEKQVPPVVEGERVGYFAAYHDEKELGRWPLVAKNNLTPRTMVTVFWDWFSSIFKTLL